MNLDDYWPPVEPREAPETPRRHKHRWELGSRRLNSEALQQTWVHGLLISEPGDEAEAAYVCFQHAEPVVRDEAKARRGKSSRRLGHDGERRSEKRYGWVKVGEFGGITDLQGTLAIVQQKTSRRAPPPSWQSIFRALEARAGGRIPLILLSFVKQGVDTEDFIVIRGRDWIQLHGLDNPGGTE